jgi:hypothetical protein
MKRSAVMRLLALAAIACVLGLVSVCSAVAAPAVNGVVTLKSELGPNNKLVAGPDGNIWVTLADETEDVAKIPPSAGPAEEFDLGKEVKNLTGIAVGPEGDLWIVQQEGVVRFSPANPVKTATPFKIEAVENEASIVAGPDGKMWVAEKEKLIRFSPGDPEGTAVSFAVEKFSPKDIDVAGPLIVVADANTESDRIATFTTSTPPVEKDYSIEGGSQGVAGSPSGQIGFSQQIPKTGKPEQVGLITPPNPAQAFEQPDDPFGVAFGSDDAFWTVRSGSKGGLARLTSTGQLSLLGGFPAEAKARQIAAGPGNTLWVSMERVMEPGLIVRVSGLEPPLPPTPPPAPLKATPQTQIDKGPKKIVKTSHKLAKVTFGFTSSIAGGAFECALTKAKKGKKPARPHFKTCKSPKHFNLKPGNYRFSVRAVNAGLTDPSPATRGFRVVHLS